MVLEDFAGVAGQLALGSCCVVEEAFVGRWSLAD